MRIWSLVLLVAVLAVGCQTNEHGTPEEDPGEYQQPGKLLEKEIQDRIAAMEFASGTKLIEHQRRLAFVGEPAIPYLLDGLKTKGPLTRGSCAYVLGLISDIRTIPALREVAENDPVPEVRYEAAAALLQIGDVSGYAVLIEGLRDENIRNRYKCFEMLHGLTKLDFGYEHDGEPEEREAAVKRWEKWWELDRRKP
jgi:hypothetical protein